MKTFDPITLRALRADIDAALLAVATKHNIVLKAGKCTYGAATCTFKLDAAILAEGDAPGVDPRTLKARADWANYCGMFDLPADGVGKTIQHGGKPHTILGLMPNRPKYPVLVDCGGRQLLLLTAEEVALRLKAAPKA